MAPSGLCRGNFSYETHTVLRPPRQAGGSQGSRQAPEPWGKPARGVCGLRRPIRRPLESEKPNRSRPPGVVCHSACASECADVIHTDRRQGTDMRACRGEERSLAPGVGLHGLRRAVSPGCPLSQAARRVRMPMKRWDLSFFFSFRCCCCCNGLRGSAISFSGQ